MEGSIHGPFDHRFNIKSLIHNFKNLNFLPIYFPFNIMAVIRNESVRTHLKCLYSHQ